MTIPVPIHLGEGGRLLNSGVTSPQGIVQLKVTWGDKGREGGRKIGFLGWRHLWMVPNINHGIFIYYCLNLQKDRSCITFIPRLKIIIILVLLLRLYVRVVMNPLLFFHIPQTSEYREAALKKQSKNCTCTPCVCFGLLHRKMYISVITDVEFDSEAGGIQ